MYSESPVVGPWIPVIEEVHELLHSHRVRVRQVAVLYEAARHRVGRGIHVDSEGGQMVLLGVYEWVDAMMLEEGRVVGFSVHCCRTADGVETLSLPLIDNDLFLHSHFLHRLTRGGGGGGRSGLVAGCLLNYLNLPNHLFLHHHWLLNFLDYFPLYHYLFWHLFDHFLLHHNRLRRHAAARRQDHDHNCYRKKYCEPSKSPDHGATPYVVPVTTLIFVCWCASIV